MKQICRKIKNYQIVSRNFLVDKEEQQQRFQDFLVKFNDIHSVSLKHQIIRLPVEIKEARIHNTKLCDHPISFLGAKYQYTTWQPYVSHEEIETFFNDLNVLELLSLWRIAVFTGTEEESFWYPGRTSLIVFRDVRGQKYWKDNLVYKEKKVWEYNGCLASLKRNSKSETVLQQPSNTNGSPAPSLPSPLTLRSNGTASHWTMVTM